MSDAGMTVSGIDLAIAGDVPVGAGLASSAAFELAVARAISYASGLPWDPKLMARICQRAENAYVGVDCGIMDQFASANCAAGHALLLDCRTLEGTNVPIPTQATFVVMDTGVRRSLAESEYNDRRASCDAAAAVLRKSNPEVLTLRDATAEMLADSGSSIDSKTSRRAAHVINEIARPRQLADALVQGDLGLAGKLMDDSHESLRDLYEVSCPELDLITSIAREHSACHGARMTGAGFGGCAVALVETADAAEFVSSVGKDYAESSEEKGAMYVCDPSAGASVLPM